MAEIIIYKDIRENRGTREVKSMNGWTGPMNYWRKKTGEVVGVLHLTRWVLVCFVWAADALRS